MPALIEKNRRWAQQLLTVHKSVGFSLLGLIALHVSAALFHHFWRRDDTLTGDAADGERVAATQLAGLIKLARLTQPRVVLIV